MSQIEKTFIIPVIRTDFLPRCLETLWKYNEMEKTRVVVVDQSLHGISEDLHDKIHLLLRPRKNLGFAKSMNEGILHAMYWGSDYVICSNDDVEFMHLCWWEGILTTFEDYPKAMVVNPASTKDRNAEPRIPYKEEYTDEEYFNLLTEHDKGVIDGICMWMPVFPRETIEKIGLFDERFFPGGGEDYDYNARIYKAGGRAIGTFRSWVIHHWGKSKDEYSDASREALPPHQEHWNSLGELWPDSFDIYGNCGDRVSEVCKIPI